MCVLLETRIGGRVEKKGVGPTNLCSLHCNLCTPCNAGVIYKMIRRVTGTTDMSEEGL